MTGKYEQCLQLRDRAAVYIEGFLQNRGVKVETTYLDGAVKICHRPKDGKSRTLTIVAYWDQGFYVSVVWKGEEGEREDVRVAVGNEASRRSEFPEFDHLLVEL